MHWGHGKTKDFIRWEYLPAALAPDAPYDKDGCFSGSAVESPDGKHLLLYTGVRKTDDRDEYQTQCIADGDGALRIAALDSFRLIKTHICRKKHIAGH